MDIMNICLGAFIEKDGHDITRRLYDTMKAELLKAGMTMGRFDFYTNKAQVTEAIRGNQYDIVICQENLNGDSIGAGSVKGWKQINQRVRVILIINKNKKGGRKLESLYKDADYYDAVYDQDISGILLKSLIESPRLKEKAYEYYGLTGTVDEPQTAPVTEISSEKEDNYGRAIQNQPVHSDVDEMVTVDTVTSADEAEPKPENGKKTGTEKVSQDSIYGDEEFEKVLDSMEHLISDGIVKDEKSDDFTEMVDSEEQPGEEENLFEGDSLFKNTVKNRPTTGEWQEFEENSYAYGEEKTTMVIPASGSKVIPSFIKGTIQAVMDEQLIMVGFSTPINTGNDMEDKSVTLLVQIAPKGHIENGRYKASHMAIKSYVNCMLDENTVVLEVPDQSMTAIENMIVGKDCNVIFKNI